MSHTIGSPPIARAARPEVKARVPHSRRGRKALLGANWVAPTPLHAERNEELTTSLRVGQNEYT